MQIQDSLGQGSHARVYRADYLCSSVAIKIYDNHDKASLNAFIGELEAYYKQPVYHTEPQTGHQSMIENGSLLQHPNIVQVVGAYQKNNKSYLLTELSEHGNLLQLIRSQGALSELSKALKTKLKACIQVAQALAYLHQHAQVYHRDLKAENVLVFHQSVEADSILVKLCDFGVSKRFELEANAPPTVQKASSPPSAEISQVIATEPAERTQTLGTIPWMAPEFLEHRIFTEKSDVYSFGILMYEIFRPYTDSTASVASPYPNLQLVQISYQVVNEGLRPDLGVFKRQDLSLLGQQIIPLMKQCWSSNVDDRPKARDLVKRLTAIVQKM